MPISHILRTIVLTVITGCAVACSTVETVPTVKVLPNDSGVTVEEFQAHGPTYSLLLGLKPEEMTTPPNVPSGATAKVQGKLPFSHEGTRYIIAPSGEIEVISIERAQDYDTDYYSLSRLVSAWRHALKTESLVEIRNDRGYVDQLRELPDYNAARCFYGKPRFRTFPWGKAVMFLTSYTQGPTKGPVDNDTLVLFVQGITHDGCYSVKATFPIRHPKLPNSISDTQLKGKFLLPFLLPLGEGRAITESWFAAQADDSFSPTITAYENLLTALEIKRGLPFHPAVDSEQ